ncbi:MAG: ATP-binding protein [Bacteroidales bacterium]|nr:ATP-binding protein [Bacteroidales bacterium]
MKRIVIDNLGPIRHAEAELKKLNVIIGPQSSGKSCLLKTASYCTWIEKRIQITQKPETFSQPGYFIQLLETFHKLKGYVHPDTRIAYESDFMRFSYDHASGLFEFEWKPERWKYIAPKISYIPAERNMVAAIPNWFDVKLPDDNIRSFMSDWQNARTSVQGGLPILNLGVTYHYDTASNSDKVKLENGTVLDFTNTSSGLQSLVPLAVQIEYLTNTRFLNHETSISRQAEYTNLYKTIKLLDNNSLSTIDTEKTFNDFTTLPYNWLFIEEPEQNLFPPTQTALIYYLMYKMAEPHGGGALLSTHSPYIVTALLEEKGPEDISLFAVRENPDGSFDIITASDEEVQQIYDENIDAFHNLSSITGS